MVHGEALGNSMQIRTEGLITMGWLFLGNKAILNPPWMWHPYPDCIYPAKHFQSLVTSLSQNFSFSTHCSSLRCFGDKIVTKQEFPLLSWWKRLKLFLLKLNRRKFSNWINQAWEIFVRRQLRVIGNKGLEFKPLHSLTKTSVTDSIKLYCRWCIFNVFVCLFVFFSPKKARCSHIFLCFPQFLSWNTEQRQTKGNFWRIFQVLSS